MLANVVITIQPDKPLERFRGDPGPESLERRTRIYRECSLGAQPLQQTWSPRVFPSGSVAPPCGGSGFGVWRGAGGCWGILLKGSEKRALGRGRAGTRRCGRGDRTGPGAREPGSPGQLGHCSAAAGAAGGDCSRRPARRGPRGLRVGPGGLTGRAERPAGHPPSLGEGRQDLESFYQQSRAIRGREEGDNRVL